MLRDISTTQMLIFLGALSVTVVLFVALLGKSRPLVEAEIVSPDDGEVVQPGSVVVRIRATGREDLSYWRLSYRRADEGTEWHELESGDSPAYPMYPDRGLYVIDMEQPGDYELRLIVELQEDGSQAIDLSEFTIDGG